ncbi:MAG TPA: nucleotidyltransferase domain-containing protein [Solirubrobacteraceae bacterium]|nr:nucleotidyltransferase domain-containing protein [Solirubrobacteraceae bacterium]
MDFHKPLGVVTSTLDGDVLAVLARADLELTSSEIRRLAGVGSMQGIRNTAERLTREGIVSRRIAGNTHLYRLNREHVAAKSIEVLASLPERVVKGLREAISGWVQPPALAFLFGSAATGNATADSDVDLLIVRPSGINPDSLPWTRQLADLQAQATAWTGNDTRILEYGEEEMSISDPVVFDALRDGIELFDTDRVPRSTRKAPGQ